ncbi:plasmid recombination protein [Pontibacter sp. E15-1]|nr:plasmid recombination protein [Pontibacter sp. E15-1]MCJ8166004.1 plasmid recombination protein [Pontibacter sp. E15-1]
MLGKENLVLHLDEKPPHLHAVVVAPGRGAIW